MKNRSASIVLSKRAARASLSAAFALLVSFCLSACADMSQILQSGAGGSATPSDSMLARGIKESLELGSTRAAQLLSQSGGYSNHSMYRIELPETIQPLTGRFRQFGLGKQVDQIELLMNQGAEHAAVEAKAIFIEAVRGMTVTDALGIVRGHDTAATEYFRRHTEASLRQRYRPIIQGHLQQIGFYGQYQQLLTAYKRVPLADKPDLDLEQHVLTKSLDALFKQVAQEERAIRMDPLGRGSSAIAAVFGR